MGKCGFRDAQRVSSILQDLQRIQRGEKLTDQILRSLRDCTGFHPDLKAYIFREILAACAACDDLTSFRQITERYGNRFEIVRSIPFKKSLTEISRDSGEDISREAGGYHSSLDLSDRRDRDPFITRKKEYLDLLDIGKLPEEISGGTFEVTSDEPGFVTLYCGMFFKKQAVVGSMPAWDSYALQIAFMENDTELAQYLSHRGVKESKKQILVLRPRKDRYTDRYRIGVLDTAILCADERAVAEALRISSPDTRFRPDSLLMELPEQKWGRLLQTYPELSLKADPDIIIRYASPSLLKTWIQMTPGTVTEKAARLFQSMGTSLDISITEEDNEPASASLRVLRQINQFVFIDDLNRTRCFLNELYGLCRNQEDKRLVCQLATLYRMWEGDSSQRIPDQDMKKYFAGVTDMSWYFCLCYRGCFSGGKIKKMAEVFSLIRKWKGYREQDLLFLGQELDRCRGYTMSPVILSSDCLEYAIHSFRFEGRIDFLTGLADELLDLALWDLLLPGYEHGFLSMEDLTRFVSVKRPAPDAVVVEIMKKMKNASVSRELFL